MKKIMFLACAFALMLLPQSASSQTELNFSQLPQSVATVPDYALTAGSSAGPTLKEMPLYVSPETGLMLIGAVLYHPSFSANSQYNFYTIPTEDADEIQLGRWSNATGGLQPNGGGFFSADMSEFEYIQYMNFGTTVYMYYYKYDTETWEVKDGHSVKNQQLLAFDTTRDPSTGIPYGVFVSENGRELGIVDYDNQTRSNIGKLSVDLVTLAADANGRLMGIGTDGCLYEVSKDDASLTLIGQTGVVPADVQQSAVVDPASGRMFWVGIPTDQKSALYEVDPTTGETTKIYGFTGLIQIVCLNIKPSDIPAGAPAAVEQLALHFEGASLEGTMAFTMPHTTFGGEALTGRLTYHVLVNGQEDFSGEAEAGAQVEEDLELQGGQNLVQVYVSNAEGDGPKGEGVSLWVGDDVPVAPAHVSLTVVDQQTLRLTWDVPAHGINNGYMNPDDLSYDLIRYPDSLTVAHGLKANEFTDHVSPEHLTPYSYDIVAYGKYGRGETVRSAIVKVGDAFHTPYLCQFNNEYDFDVFTVTDLNGDATTWHYYPYSARYRFSKDGAANDLLVTPPVQLGTDRLYRLSFRYRTMGDPERLKVTFGRASADATAYDQVIMPMTELRNRQNEVFSTMVRVSEATAYSMAFLCQSTTDGFHLFLDDISFTDGPMLTAPDSVHHLVVKPADKGALAATLTFTTPSLTVVGQQLARISKIDILRNGQHVATIDSPATGTQLSFTDESPDNGFNSYTVVAYDAEGNPGLEATQRAYIGMDAPDSPTNVRIVEEENGNITITWDAPAAGQNGGYIDAENLSYDIMRVMGGQQTQVDSYLDLEPYVDEVDQTGENQNIIYYGVAARNELGQSDYQQSNALVAGRPFDFPFRESFPGGIMEHPFLSSNHSDQLNWPMESADDDGGCISFIQNSYDYLYLETGKISLQGATMPGLVYSLKEQPGHGKLYVQVSSNTGERQTIEVVDFAKFTETRWGTHTMMLTDFADKPYVRVRFLYENDGQTILMLDNINVRDVVPTNVALAKLQLPAKASAGVETPVTAHVVNAGSAAISAASVELYVNDQLQQTLPVGTLGVNADEQVQLSALFNTAMKGEARVRLEVVADDDQISTDNTLESTLQVVVEDYPAVTDLHGQESQDGHVSLAWTQPLLEGFAPSVTDDAESYEPYIIDGIGDWTVYDGDGAPCYTIPNSQVQFPNLGTEFAVMILNPYTVFKRTEVNPYTHSGNQCFSFWDAQARLATETEGRSDDWLISPLLSQLQQTVTFWARSMTTVDYAEDFEVLYSTTGNLPGDFRANVVLDVQQCPGVWTEYKADLPAGAKYFAIHMKSLDQFALLVDDITYQPEIPGGEVVVRGYNVYRDAQLIGFTETPAYDDVMPGDGAVYEVTVVYATAESPLSNRIGFGTQGVEAIDNEKPAGNATYDLMGRRVATPTKGIYLNNGKKVIIK
ncbi:MAG: choice-of-anchor J domain-containing protein [Prevotella sp.]|nr:choice-of-anchor J domain-containing protein [Prevotella sp.]